MIIETNFTEEEHDVIVTPKEKLNIFSFVFDISFEKKNIFEGNEAIYDMFMINRTFSLFEDTIYFANLMVMSYGLTKKMHHDFLFYSIPKRKRFAKWDKVEDNEIIRALMERYKYNHIRARHIAERLCEKDKEQLRHLTFKGGLA